MSSVGAELRAENPEIAGSRLGDSRQRKLLLGLLLILATIAIYYPVHHHPFFNLDDGIYVTHNPYVQNGPTWTTVKWAFTAFDQSNWVPLSFVSHAIDYRMFGDNAGGHHDVSMMLQALNAVLLFWVLASATGYTGRSFMVAALFAVHPLNVEAVAWISERKTVLSMVFFLLALGAYRWYAQRPKPGRYAVVAVLFALGLCAKAQIITLPAVLLLWDYWPLQRMFPPSAKEASMPHDGASLPAKSVGWLVLEKLPLLLLCGLDALFTVMSEKEARSKLWPPLSERLGNAIFSYVRYIEKAFWPSAMAPLYPNRGPSLSLWEIGGSLVFLLAITAWVITVRKRQRYLLVGWFLFLGTLVPMLQIVQFGKEGMADRFAYQALIGLFIMVCWGVADWAEQRRISTQWLTAAGLVVLVALVVVAHRQVNFWQDDLTLWEHGAAVVPGHWEAEDNIGVALLHQGKPESVVLPHFFRAAAMHPSDPVSNMHLAIYEQRNGNLRQAIAHYQQVLLTPAPAQVQAQIYQNMGLAYSQLSDAAKARECFDQAVSLRTR